MLKLNTKWLSLLGALLAVSSAAFAAEDQLLDLLVKKGIVTTQEAQDLSAEMASKAAAEKKPAGNEVKISGDLRVRYEFRSGQNLAGDNIDRNRFRYRLRPSFTGNLGSQWFYGFRLEGGSGSRSSNGTMADDGGPWAKTNDALYIGQVYLGYKATKELTLVAGRMPNPFVTTSLVWDGDINPEGVAEKFTRSVGGVTYFANLGQFLYDSANPQNNLAPAASKNDQYFLGWQGGVTVKLDKINSIQVAPALYNYVNNNRDAKTFVGAFSPTNQTAINNLFVLDVPVTYTTALATGIPFSVFGDFAYNFDGKDRARKYGRADLDDEVFAWQLGAQYGKAKKKGEWDAKAFYQQTGLFALDANLVDSDLFDSRVNAEGFVLGANYQLSDAVVFSLTYANGKTKDKSAISAGSGDLGLPTMKSFNLLQLDFVAKF